MSRGLGLREREVLEAIRAGSRTLRQIIAEHHTLPVSEALYRSYARAARSLVRKSLIADAGVGWHGTSGARHYMSPDEFAREQARVVAAFGSPYRLTRPLNRPGLQSVQDDLAARDRRHAN